MEFIAGLCAGAIFGVFVMAVIAAGKIASLEAQIESLVNAGINAAMRDVTAMRHPPSGGSNVMPAPPVEIRIKGVE